MKKLFSIFLALTIFANGADLFEDFASVRLTHDSSETQWHAAADGGCVLGQVWAVDTANKVATMTVPSGTCLYLMQSEYAYGGPLGYMSYSLKTGTWNPLYNRFTYDMMCDWGWTDPTNSNDPAGTVGSYVRNFNNATSNDGGSQHYYQDTARNLWANHWAHITLNSNPQHARGSNEYNAPIDPEWVQPSTAAGFGAGAITPVHFWDGQMHIYISSQHAPTWAPMGGGHCSFKNFYFDIKSGEPDGLVTSLTAAYTGTKYHVDFYTSRNVTEHFAARYATASMKTNGFSSGTATSDITSTGDVVGIAEWNSPVMAEVSNLYVAFRPKATIFGATNASPIRVSIQADYLLTDGDSVTVAGALGNTAANGTFTVTNVTQKNWAVNYPATPALTSVVCTSGTCTVTTSSAHGITTGMWINIFTGATAPWSYTQVTPVLSTPTSTTFTFGGIAAAADGTYNFASNNDMVVWTLPAYDLGGSTGNGTYTSGGALTATSNTKNFTQILIADGAAGTNGGSTLGGKFTEAGKNQTH